MFETMDGIEDPKEDKRVHNVLQNQISGVRNLQTGTATKRAP